MDGGTTISGDEQKTHPVSRVLEAVPSWLGVLVAVGLFLVAIQMLGSATAALSPIIERFLQQVVRGDAPALGLSWLTSYLLGNGSVVAAIALSLFAADLLTTAQLFLMVAGSRLGAAAIVILIGAVDHVQHRRPSLGESIGLGLLAFLTTYAVYIPATIVGYLLVPSFELAGRTVSLPSLTLETPALLGSLLVRLTTSVGPHVVYVLALLLLFGSLSLFDRISGRIDTAWLRRNYIVHLRNRWVSFTLGLLVAGLTASVSFALGAIVPLYNRRYVKRDELVPYIMGANVGTLVDTLVVALVLDSPVGTAAVAGLLVLTVLLTLVELLVFPQVFDVIDVVYVRIVENPTLLYGFLALLALVPTSLLFAR